MLLLATVEEITIHQSMSSIPYLLNNYSPWWQSFLLLLSLVNFTQYAYVPTRALLLQSLRQRRTVVQKPLPVLALAFWKIAEVQEHLLWSPHCEMRGRNIPAKQAGGGEAAGPSMGRFMRLHLNELHSVSPPAFPPWSTARIYFGPKSHSKNLGGIERQTGHQQFPTLFNRWRHSA